ncbi:MAG: B12-binding domain-containing radical SAM protein, partial [Calditrichae bacterium]|nr:B12-binding domain-containing radical SAM protein [Calditrichia bacterium]
SVEQYFKLKGKRQFDYISSTGCYFRCAFCADPFVYNRKWTALEPDRMGEELEHHRRQYQFDDVDFQDETFFTYRKRVVGVTEQFIQRNIDSTWAGTMRADQGSRLTEEDFALCAKSGLRRVL